MTPLCHAQLRSQRIVDGLPQTTSSPGMIGMRNDPIGWKVTREVPPGAAVSIEIKDGSENFPSVISDFAAPLFRRRKQRFNDAPFSVAQICGGGFPHWHLQHFFFFSRLILKSLLPQTISVTVIGSAIRAPPPEADGDPQERGKGPPDCRYNQEKLFSTSTCSQSSRIAAPGFSATVHGTSKSMVCRRYRS